jgi:hypothetical protein
MAKSTHQTGQAGLVVFAKSVKKLSAFYARTLGLEVLESASSHQLLRGNGYEVVVHAFPAKMAREITIAKPPVLREDSAMKPSFVVPDLEALRSAVVATGGWLKPAELAWTIRGHTVLDGCDPEGNILQFKQKL